MNRYFAPALLLAPLLICGLCSAASASQTSFELTGVTQEFPEVSAFRVRDRSNVQEFNTLVLLTKTAPDRAAIAQAEDPYQVAINDPATDDDNISLWIDGDGIVRINATIDGVQYLDSSGMIFGEKGALLAECSENTETTIACKVTTPEPVKTSSGAVWSFATEFESEVLARKPGKPVDADGKQIKVLAALDQARLGNDLEAILKHLVPSKAEQYRQDWNTPEENLAEVIDTLERSLPTSPQWVEGEYVNDDEVTLLVSGKIESWGEDTLIFRVSMHRVDGRWLFEGGSFVGMQDAD